MKYTTTFIITFFMILCISCILGDVMFRDFEEALNIGVLPTRGDFIGIIFSGTIIGIINHG